VLLNQLLPESRDLLKLHRLLERAMICPCYLVRFLPDGDVIQLFSRRMYHGTGNSAKCYYWYLRRCESISDASRCRLFSDGNGTGTYSWRTNRIFAVVTRSLNQSSVY